MEYELQLMEINELSAFELGIKEEQKTATKFAVHYSLDLENGYWELNAHYNDHVLWINAESYSGVLISQGLCSFELVKLETIFYA